MKKLGIQKFALQKYSVLLQSQFFSFYKYKKKSRVTKKLQNKHEQS